MAFTALLDTNVLWPSLQRDFLLSLAVEGLYRAVWSSAILDELKFHEAQKLRNRHNLDASVAEIRAARLIQKMRAAFGDAEIAGWEVLEGTYGLPDPDDEHVLAAAHLAGAGSIVTSNVKDFPVGQLPDGIDVIPPHQFALDTTALNPALALLAIRAISDRTGGHAPRRAPTEIIEALESRYMMGEAMDLVRSVQHAE